MPPAQKRNVMQNHRAIATHGEARLASLAKSQRKGSRLTHSGVGKSRGAAGLLSALLLGAMLVLSAQADPLDCWTRSHQTRELYRVMFVEGLWVAAGYNEILTSSDGSHWTNRFVPAGEEDSLFLALARGNGVFVAAGILYATGT